MEFDGMELSEAIAAVRSGLSAAQQEGLQSELRFRVKEVVLDLGLEMHRTNSGSGSVKAYVFSGEARHEGGTAHTHRITLTLEIDEESGADQLSPQN